MPPDPRCPSCDGELVIGTVRIEGTKLGLLFIGLSYQNLYFRSPLAKPGLKHRVLESREERAGYICKECELVMIAPPRR
jgi:hypothetical protein